MYCNVSGRNFGIHRKVARKIHLQEAEVRGRGFERE